jgi:hypothetical protein
VIKTRLQIHEESDGEWVWQLRRGSSVRHIAPCSAELAAKLDEQKVEARRLAGMRNKPEKEKAT